MHSHNSGTSRSLVTNLLHRINSLTLPMAEVSKIAVSHPAGRWIFGEASSYAVIHNGVDVDRFAFRADVRERARSDLDLGDGFVVGNVGAFLPAKNHAFLISIFKRVLAQAPNAKLLLIGTGPLQQEIRKTVITSGIDDKVLFLNQRADVPDLLSAMDCMVFPSLYEGFPLAVVEAQAAGLPIVLSDVTTSEVAVAEMCSYLPLSLDPALWAQAIVGARRLNDRREGRTAIMAAGL